MIELFGLTVKDKETSERFLYDFRKTVSELFIHNLYRNARDICDKHGLSDVSVEKLYEHKYIKKNDKVKVLGGGELKSKVNVKVHKCSASAKEAIEAKGGTVELI